ncbi:MAG: Gfo/Idh/MocA family protein [Thermoleophilaceae bacterium]
MNSSSENADTRGELRVGIAGFGVVGNIRRTHIDSHPRLRTVAVCDQKFPEPFTADDGVRCWTDYKELLEEELDLLFVCMPNYMAANVTIAGLERGLHVFCEKPPGRDVSDIARVREAEAARPGQKLMYGFNHRYHDSVREAKRVIESGELGSVIDMKGVYGKSVMIRFDSDWRTKRDLAGGGILLDQGIHMVDMMRLFAGDFTDVHSYVTNDYWNHDVEDNAYALMRTEEGVVAMLHSSATQWRHRFNLDIAMTQGALELSGILSSSKSYGAETLRVVFKGEDEGGDPREQITRYNRDNSWHDEVFDFAGAVLDGKPIPGGTSLDALKTVQLVYDIYRADPEWARRWDLAAAAAGHVT